MKKLLPLVALLGAALLVIYKTTRARSGDDLWQEATSPTSPS
ncbi:MAG: DLW-39 family protein [Pseudonocardia sp.]